MNQDDDFYNGNIDSNDKIKASSKRTYKCNMSTLVKTVGSESIHELITNPEKYIPIIESTLTKNTTRKNAYLVILTYLRNSDNEQSMAFNGVQKQWYVKYATVRDLIIFNEKNNILTEKREKSKIVWEDVIKLRDKLVYGSMDHLLLSMYTYIEPRRQADFHKMRIYDEEAVDPIGDHTFIHLCHPPNMCFMNIIENRAYADIIQNIPIELVNIIRASQQQFPRDYIFVTRKGDPYNTPNAYTIKSNEAFKRLFDNKLVSLTSIGHAYANRINGI
jgi:uncharacterized protein with HEPN domain